MPDHSSPHKKEACAHTAIRCLVVAALEKGVELNPDALVHEYNLKKEPPIRRLLRILTDKGFRARHEKLSWEKLIRLGKAYPCLARLKDGNTVVVFAPMAGIDSKEVYIRVHDPCAAPSELQSDGFLYLNRKQFTEKWSGRVVLFKRHFKLADPDQEFGLRWFIPEILRQKRAFSEIVLAAFFLYAISLFTPIFFQIVIDKVLVHEAVDTLNVLGIGILGALLFDAIITFLQKYLLLFSTSKIDVRVGTRTFKKLMKLPIDYFEHVPAGITTKNMQQSSIIREFMTGRLFMTVLDSMSLLIFIPVLFFYSWPLTLVVLTITGLIALVLLALIPIYKARIDRLYNAEGARQSILFEAVKGMLTIKSLAVEPVKQEEWNNSTSNVVNRHFEVGKITNWANTLTGFLEKIMTVVIVWIGAGLVFGKYMSVGELVAFNMLAGRVSGPLVQLATLIHEFQEAKLSVDKLGLIMNHGEERNGKKQVKIPGHFDNSIHFEYASFTYPNPDNPSFKSPSPTLKNIKLNVHANPSGATIGIVGRSGSGKTTLTKLIQGYYLPDEGQLSIGGHDIKDLDLAALRRNIGVVLQENFLFRGSIAENIKLRKQNATREEVERAARLARAHEFIVKLPDGYDTILDEGAVNLSGGERQRLAIARALITEPIIMIFDEATSALDPVTEKHFRDNIRQLSHGRTMIIVSHRLSTLHQSDLIVVLDGGEIVGSGKHDALLADGPQGCDIYKELWQEQTIF